MALGTTASILLATGLGAAGGFGASKLISRSGEAIPFSPQPIPQPPRPEASAVKADEIIRRRKAASTQTVYTSPLGVSGEAQVVRKTLLGQ